MTERWTREQGNKFLTDFIDQLRRTYPPQRIENIAPPINLEELRATNPGPLYDGFLEDVRRMRRGLEPLGPRE